jgi:hypothetical protein
LLILNMSTTAELSPEDQRKADTAQRAREAAEQATLPYAWTQTIKDLDLTLPISASLRARDLDISLTKTHLKVAIKGQHPIIDADFHKQIKVDDSTWTLETVKVGKEVAVHLEKANGMEWWSCVVKGAPELDTSKIQPENSQLSELDGETRGMVEKMM